MAILHKNIQNPNDIHNPKWLPSANNGDYAFKNEKGQLESIDELLLPGALNFVDGSVAPPTTSTGDIYILSSGASVNAGWGSVALQDWVRYDGTAWNSLTPQKSSLCYDKTADSLKFFNGTAWAAIGGGGGGSSIYTADDTIGTGRVATLTDSVSFGNLKIDYDNILSNYVLIGNRTQMTSVSTCNILIASNGGMGFNVPAGLDIQFNIGGSAVGFIHDDKTWSFGTHTGKLGSAKVEIKGDDTLSSSSALQIYDGDGTPNSLWDFRNNGDVHLGQSTTFNSTNFEIINLTTTSGANSYATLNSNSTGQNISLRFEQGGAPKYNIGSWNSIFTIYNFTSGSQVLTIDTTDKVNLLTPSVTTKDFNIGGTVDITNSDTNPLNVSSLASGNCFLSINSNSASFNANIQYKQGGASKWNAGVLADGSFSFYNHTSTNTPIKIKSSNVINMPNLPTSASGLSSGDIYNDSGTLKIV